VERNPIRMCELLVGLPDVNVLGIEDGDPDTPVRIHVETRGSRPRCRECGGGVGVKERPLIELVDLAVFGRPARLVWRKHRWLCVDPACSVGSWTEQELRIAPPRLALTDRAGRWVTEQVGRHGRTVNEVAGELGCDWHTVNDAVIAYGTVLVDDEDRIGDVTALGLDETLFCREGPWRRQAWSTSIVDVRAGRLLDVVEGRDTTGPSAWLAARGETWCERIEWATLDLSGPYRKVFDTMLPGAVQVADPFHRAPRGARTPRRPGCLPSVIAVAGRSRGPSWRRTCAVWDEAPRQRTARSAPSDDRGGPTRGEGIGIRIGYEAP
jgi:transposase